MGRVETPGLGGAGSWATPIGSAHARAGALNRSCRQVPRPDPESRWEAVGRGNGRNPKATPTPNWRAGLANGSAPFESWITDFASCLLRGRGMGRPSPDEGLQRLEARGLERPYRYTEGRCACLRGDPCLKELGGAPRSRRRCRGPRRGSAGQCVSPCDPRAAGT